MKKSVTKCLYTPQGFHSDERTNETHLFKKINLTPRRRCIFFLRPLLHPLPLSRLVLWTHSGGHCMRSVSDSDRELRPNQDCGVFPKGNVSIFHLGVHVLPTVDKRQRRSRRANWCCCRWRSSHCLTARTPSSRATWCCQWRLESGPRTQTVVESHEGEHKLYCRTTPFSECVHDFAVIIWDQLTIMLMSSTTF
jgi:hypothetical protein